MGLIDIDDWDFLYNDLYNKEIPMSDDLVIDNDMLIKGCQPIFYVNDNHGTKLYGINKKTGILTTRVFLIYCDKFFISQIEKNVTNFLDLPVYNLYEGRPIIYNSDEQIVVFYPGEIKLFNKLASDNGITTVEKIKFLSYYV